MIRQLTATALALTVAAGFAQAQELMKEVAKDFGSVPRGALLLHQFTLNNPFSSNLTIGGVRTSCTCASASIGTAELKPGESTVLAVTVDTNKYVGSRSFTVYVLVTHPVVQELQVVVSANSREDLTLSPGQLNFGRVDRGTVPTASVSIDYRGFHDFKITSVENENQFIQPTLEEKVRAQGLVSYQLSAKLRADTPVGAWHADVWLKTNDQAMPRICVPLIVQIESALKISPTDVNFGRVSIGSRAEYRLTVRGPKPFKILKVDGGDEKFQLTWSADQAKQAHVVRLTLLAGDEPAEVRAVFHVLTDLEQDSEGEFRVTAQVTR